MEQGKASDALKRIERPLRLTWAGLWAERMTRAFWPLWTVALLALAAAAFGLQDILPIEAAWFGIVASVVGLIAALIHGFRSFHRPARTEALVRLDANLPGQPIAALRDTMAIGADDPASRAVWAAHRARMAIRAAQAKAVEPNLQLASRDPFGLRYIALTAAVMAVLFGSVWRVASVSGLVPGGAIAAMAGPTWEGWAQPPAYTGKPALYLTDQKSDTLSLPQGTKVQLNFYGDPGALILSETVSARTTVPAASDNRQEFTVKQSGVIAIDGTGGRAWQVIATPDTAPSIEAKGDIARQADGRFKQQFTAKDDYGVTKGQVAIALDLPAVARSYGLIADPEVQPPVILDLVLPVKGSRAEFTTTLVDDLSQHVFANMPVTMTFSASDAAMQTGASAPIKVILPGRRFFEPTAAAIIEMRRDLLWTRANGPRVVQILKAMTWQADVDFRQPKALARLRAVTKALDQTSLTPGLRDTAALELWNIALMVEEGDLADAKERLRRAQDRLDEAIKNGASPEEIRGLMDEMRQALNDYMKQEADKAPDDPNDETSRQQQGKTITQDQIQQMLDKLQQLMQEGRTAEAQQLMEQLRQMMENMQVQKGQGQGQGQGAPGEQGMKQLGETMRGQQRLSDDSFRDLQDGQPGNQGKADQQGNQPKPGQKPGDSGKSLSDRQVELRDQLDQLGKNGKLPSPGSELGESGRQRLDEAGRAMDQAEKALREGNLPDAMDRQAEAIDKMREGIRDLGDALAKDQQQRNGQSPNDTRRADSADPNGTRDPLGRDNSAHIGSDKNLLQGEDVYRRAQELLDEIRKRSGEQTRPSGERDYLKRLLDLF